MSDKSEDTIQLKLTLERIANKIENSPVLNGGWERLEERTEKIHAMLIEPPNGLFYQVKDSQNNIDHVNTTLKSHLKKDEELQEKLVETTNKTSESIEDLTKWKKNINRAFWAVFVPILAILGKVIVYDLLNIHPGHH